LFRKKIQMKANIKIETNICFNSKYNMLDYKEHRECYTRNCFQRSNLQREEKKSEQAT